MGVVYVNGVSVLMGCCAANASVALADVSSASMGLTGEGFPALGGTQPRPATASPGVRGHCQGWSVAPELPSSSQHCAAGTNVHGNGPVPCPGACGSLPPFPAPLLPAGAGQCRGFGEWGASSITVPATAPQPAPRRAVMPGTFITPSPALLSCNWSGHLVIPHLPTGEALAALAAEPDLPCGCRQRAGKAGAGGCAC